MRIHFISIRQVAAVLTEQENEPPAATVGPKYNT